MITHWPSPDGTPDEPDDTPAVPDEVWRQFLCDSEHAIRMSAPREPSARERGQGPFPSDDAVGSDGTTGAEDGDGRSARGDGAGRAGRRRPVAHDPVDGVWGPDDPWAGPAWGELDGRARLRRTGRVIVTAVAITLALGAWSQLSTGAGAPVDSRPHRTTVGQLPGDSEEFPAASRVPPGSAKGTRPPSSSAAG